MAKNVGGRPTVFTPAVIQKLEYAFSNDFNINEACLYADIANSSFYNYCDQNEGFLERMKSLRARPQMQAKINIAEKIKDKDVDISQWLLERRQKDEYSKASESKVTVSGSYTKTIEINPAEQISSNWADYVRGKIKIDDIKLTTENKLPVIDVATELQSGDLQEVREKPVADK